jgi:uncharacterized protein
MWHQIRYFALILFATTLISNNLASASPIKHSVQDETLLPTKSSANFSPRPISKVKRELIQKLLETTGGKQKYNQIQKVILLQQQQEFPKIIQQMIDSSSTLTPSQKKDAYAKANGRISPLINEFSKYLSEDATYQEILERVYYPTYDQYFTELDLTELISFYETPIGKKLILISPQLSATSQKLTFEVIMPRLSQILSHMMKQEINSISPLPTAPLKR